MVICDSIFFSPWCNHLRRIGVNLYFEIEGSCIWSIRNVYQEEFKLHNVFLFYYEIYRGNVMGEN